MVSMHSEIRASDKPIPSIPASKRSGLHMPWTQNTGRQEPVGPLARNTSNWQKPLELHQLRRRLLCYRSAPHLSEDILSHVTHSITAKSHRTYSTLDSFKTLHGHSPKPLQSTVSSRDPHTLVDSYPHTHRGSPLRTTR